MTRVAIVLPRSKSGEIGGAEVFAGGLVDAFHERGIEADRLDVVIGEATFDDVLRAYSTFDALDLDDYDVVISTKAPSFAVRHRRHVLYLLHTMRVFYDRFDSTLGGRWSEYAAQRDLIFRLDRELLRERRFVARFAIGDTAVRRLSVSAPASSWGHFEILHCPPALAPLLPPRAGRFLLAPGRLHPWKRVDLLLRAFRDVDRDVPLLVVGRGESEAELRRIAKRDHRVRFLGHVPDERLRELYAEAIGVAFVPVEEDLGLVTLEAFRAGKPVVTCSDSGEPARIVRHGTSGFVVPPEPGAIAGALTRWIDDPAGAAEMGMRGCESIGHMTWNQVIERLCAAIGRSRRSLARSRPRAYRVLVADMQPIEPPIGGARVRLRSLYGALGDGIEATYVGSYSWRGPSRRSLHLTPGLLEVDVPLEDDHFARHAIVASKVPDRQTIDVSLPFLLSPEAPLPTEVVEKARSADVVVLSHPWLYPAVRRRLLDLDKTLVYDAHNCEALLRGELLAGGGTLARALAEGVRQVEGALCRESDAVLACSDEDRHRLSETHGIDPGKIHVVPNAVDCRAIRPATVAERAAARRHLGLEGFVALFVGSAYPPNDEAFEAIRSVMAPRLPHVTFVVVGSVGERFLRAPEPAAARNVVVLGVVPEAARGRVYAAADVALNPVTRGSGVNVKMLDYFAAGLPVVTTAVGRRGLPAEVSVTADLDGFAAAIEDLRVDEGRRASLALRARRHVEEHHDADRLSARLGSLLRRVRPFFTVVIPTCDREPRLLQALERLERQSFRDFEVVVVDQSAPPLEDRLRHRSFPGTWLHDPVRSPARARNTGVRHARGRYVAFTDDDCLPAEDWLANAHRRLAGSSLVGLEGRVASDETDRGRYHLVSNEDFQGIGYMTANLFVRRDVIERVGGFDERFDAPHFREDTDLAWRCLELGPMPHAEDVQVLHPAAAEEAGSDAASKRAHGFVHDALLFDKHPERYPELLRREGNHHRYPSFWHEFAAGLIRHRVTRDVSVLEPFAGEAFAEVAAAAREVTKRCSS